MDGLDIRGREVLDNEGREIGRIDDVLTDPARLLRVEHDGLFGVGAGPLYIPADCVESVTDEQVRLDRTRVQIAGAAAYGPDTIDELLEYYRSVAQ
ncbi:PRC-barrel domain-containing protein [Paractinoplanes ovalisporus]|nr:DUF2171 domain-containing protein [Actinoplanes ovalisporus]